MMTKLVKKLRVNDFWNIIGHESWYTHMAQQGLFLKKKGVFFTYFERRPSENIKYRIEVSKKPLDDAQIDFYEVAGWDYVTHYNYFHVFSSPAERGAPEIHTDPANQATTLKDLTYILSVNWMITLLAAIFSICMLWAIFFLDDVPVRQLVQGNAINQLLLFFLMLFLMLQTMQASLSIQKLKKKLQSGIPLQHDVPWKKKNAWQQHIGLIAYIILAVVMIVFSAMQIISTDYRTVSQGDSRFPAINLAAIEQHNLAPNGTNFAYEEESYLHTTWSPFTVKQYKIEEAGTATMQTNSGIIPSMVTELYDLQFEFLARPLASDLMKWYGRFDSRIPSNVADSRFDKLYVRENYPSIEIAAVKGKKVVYMHYVGGARLSTVVNEVENFIKNPFEKY